MWLMIIEMEFVCMIFSPVNISCCISCVKFKLIWLPPILHMKINFDFYYKNISEMILMSSYSFIAVF